MKKVFKKSIACLIAVLMVFSTMPLSAFAWDTGLKFTKKDTSWTGYQGKYSAYISNGVDYAGIVLKEVNNNGVITVTRGQSFKITLSCGKWIKQKASNGVPQTDTLSWYFGESTDYVLSTRDATGKGDGTKWKAFLGDDTSKEIQSNITGEFATATNGPLDKYRATSGEGGTNEAYGVFEFTTSSFPQLNTPGEYKVRLAPTIIMNTYSRWKWRSTKGFGAIDWAIANENPINLDGRTISITVKVVCPHTNTELRNKADANCTTAGYSGDSYCTDCGTKLSTGSTVNALGHNYQIDNITYKAPTCTTAGKEADQFCTRCGDTITGKTINALGHDMQVVDGTAKDATCTVAGKEADKKCSRCDYTEPGATINATGHTYTSVVTAPTCTEKGYTTYTCNAGDHTYVDNYTDALGHDYQIVDGTAVEVTCTTAGKEADKKCSRCNDVITGATINATGHSEVEIPAVEATCTTAGSTAGTKCSVCDVIIVDPQTIPAKGHSYNYTYNNDGTHTKACQNCDESTSEPCTNELMSKGETSDTWYCTVCGHEYERTVIDMSALKANITALETAVNVDDAAYKYEATALADAKETLDNAKAYVANDNNRYASIEAVNAMSTSVGTAYTELTVNGLAKYSQTFIIRKDDGNGNTTDIETFTQGYENLAYGSTVEFNKYTIPTIEDESSTLNGLPMYAVYKWVKIVNGAEEKLGTTDVQISDVVKGETTYVCYVLDFKATDETQTTTRVRYLDKSGNTIKFDTATVGEPYTRKDTSIAPLIPYYNCTGWDLVFGDETTVGTRELVYRAVYTFNETEANRCTIVGLNGVSVNGTTGKPGYTAYYDEKIDLTGADKFAYANADGSIIAPINENYIFAPHLNGVDKTIYITKVETPIEDAKSIITGVFTTDDDPTYNYLVVNAQFYLPEGAKVVEAGAVIGKNNNADTLKIGSAVKVVSDTQGENHEYSLQMSYSKGKTGTLYARSYLIYVDSNGDTQTVYSDIAECVLN